MWSGEHLKQPVMKIEELCDDGKACVRFTAIQGEFRLVVSEWHFEKNGLIHRIIAHYHIGEIRRDRRLKT